MTSAEVVAPAKINLTLEITGRQADGYHLLDSLVVFSADVGDRIGVSPAATLSLRVAGPLAKGVPVSEDNLVCKAARLLARKRGVAPMAAITLEKQLPHGAGLGGGSSDAAAALKALAALWGVAPPVAEETLALGADVPVCLAGPRPALMAGIGDQVRPVRLPSFWLVLVNPGVNLKTAAVFAHHAAQFGAADHRSPPPWVAPVDLADLLAWRKGARNALTESACALCPPIGAAIAALRETAGCLDADMSGSGSTVWGLYAHAPEAQAAAAAMANRYPEFWVRATGVVS